MDQSLFPAPHGLTQGITSFIASCCQGIHQTPFSRLIWSGKRKARGLRFPPEAYLPDRDAHGLLVSVLDLDSIAVPDEPAMPRHDGASAIPMCLLSTM
jgi:hypothetical protein